MKLSSMLACLWAMMNLKCKFVEISQKIAEAAGQPACFMAAVAFIVLWAVSGPLFGFSDTWQLVVNTSTTIITFLMVFLIQSTQNRDTEALHMKLDELIRATKGAHLALLDIEELEDNEFQAFRKMYAKIGQEARDHLAEGQDDMDVPDIEIQSMLKDSKTDKKQRIKKKK